MPISGERGFLRTGQLQTLRQLCAEDSILSDEVFVLKQELLVHQARNYARKRAHLLSFIASVNHRRANETNEFKFLDPTGFA